MNFWDFLLNSVFKNKRVRGNSRLRLKWAKYLEALDSSPIPGIFVMTLVWVVTAVLLTISTEYQIGSSKDLLVGSAAPQTILAKFDFQYEDKEKTDKLLDATITNQPLYFKVETEKSNQIIKRFENFFDSLKRRIDFESKNETFVVRPNTDDKLVLKLDPKLFELFSSIFRHEATLQILTEDFYAKLSSGLLSKDKKLSLDKNSKVKIVDGNGRESLNIRLTSELSTPESLAKETAENTLNHYPALENRSQIQDALVNLLINIIQDSSTLTFDKKLTEDRKKLALQQFKPVMIAKHKGDPLIRQGEILKTDVKDMLELYNTLENSQKTFDNELFKLFKNMLWSLVLAILGGFYLYHLHPEIMRSSKSASLIGLTIIVTLLANYAAIVFFRFIIKENVNIYYGFLANAMPISLVAVLLVVMFGFRVSLCAGFYVSVVLAMMLYNNNALSFAIKGMIICALAALAVRSANNYRSYFIRIILLVFPLVWIINLNIFVVSPSGTINMIIQSGLISFANSLFTGILALMVIFFFELVFNVNTNMSLMVLCDYNHPLLERLKREAPGTFFHCLMVATLSEDAARAIGANPLKAKAGALFHDIGKLAMPQYFTENNLEMGNLHHDLNPQMSSIIIRDHVKEGILLADKYRLGQIIREAIAEHHGNDLVHFFYAKAIADGNQVFENQFRYQGNPPKSKEIAIISLADICEAACRSLEKPSANRIAERVDEIFVQRFKDGQLNCSQLTLAELDTIRDSFVNTLVSMKHGRISYFEEKKDDKSSVKESDEKISEN